MHPILLKAPAALLAAALGGQIQIGGVQPPPAQAPYLRRETSSRALYVKILEAEDRRQYSPVLADMLERPHIGHQHDTSVVDRPCSRDPTSRGALTRLPKVAGPSSATNPAKPSPTPIVFAGVR